VQVEALRHTFTKDRALQAQAYQENGRQYLCFDLTTGRVKDDYDLINFLCSNGMTDAELEWFRRNAVDFDFFGANFYPWSYRELKQRPGGSTRRVTGEPTSDRIAIVLREVHKRYHMPIMITGTSAKRDLKGRARWRDEALDTARRLHEEGV
jgi:hypothetical protein